MRADLLLSMHCYNSVLQLACFATTVIGGSVNEPLLCLYTFRQKGKVVLLGDFNARVGRPVEEDDVNPALEETAG